MNEVNTSFDSYSSKQHIDRVDINTEIKNDEDKDKILIYGTRGQTFKNFIMDLLQKTSLSYDTCKFLLSDEKIYDMFTAVFTHSSFDVKHCYEYYELIGDVLANNIIVYYLKERFPFLKNNEGVKILSRLKINLVSKKYFSKWAMSLGFEQFISYDHETKMKHNQSVLEDCFEAFLGATQTCIDQNIRGFSGYYLCYCFLKSILDKEDISLSYDDLYDPITRLKETYDHFNSSLMKGSCPYISGSISFTHEKIETGLYKVTLIQSCNSNKTNLLSENGHSIIDCKYKLCEKYLLFLKEKGYIRPQPDYYRKIEKLRMETL